MYKLNAFQALNNPNRVSSVDVFRGIAIISVVIFHFNKQLPFGFIGVDLFFVVSGLLVGGLLTNDLNNDKKISFPKFFIQRGFKIWPSYYAFLFIGGIIVYYFYHKTNPEEIIPFWDLKRYLFFYQNYTGLPFHWSFDHVWSLCVEEHFYILLPLLFLFVHSFRGKKNRIISLFTAVILTIIAGILFKHFSLYFTNSKDTYSGTHNRLDALAWGVLLNLIIVYFGDKFKSIRIAFCTFSLGLLIFIVTLYCYMKFDNFLFEKLYFHSILPFSFSLMLLGTYYFDFSFFKPLRFIAYYSYNWYLWHPIFAIIITHYLGNNMTGLVTYLGITFLVAMLTTILIEEKILKKRKKIMDNLFKSQKKA